MYRIARQIYNKIQKANHILLVPHTNPDGDALGCTTAFIQYLNSIDKNHTAYSSSEMPKHLHFLPYIDYITNDQAIFENYKFDLVITFDSGDLKRAGIHEYIANHPERPSIVNFDHHAINDMHGDYNMVNSKSSSTAEVLYYFFEKNNIKINSKMATCLLTGLITDTESFSNCATSIDSLNITSKLISLGGKAELIKNSVFKDKSINSLKMWGAVFSRLKKHPEIDIIYTYLTQKDLEKYNTSDSESDGLSNFMNNVSEGKAILIFKELPNGQIKGSFRTTRDDVDVSQIAKSLGGGGHTKAAGFTMEGKIEDVSKKVFETIKKFDI